MSRHRWTLSIAACRALRPLLVVTLLAAVGCSGCIPLVEAGLLLGQVATPNPANVTASDVARREARQHEARQLEQEALGARQRGRYWEAADKAEHALALREVDGAETLEVGQDLALLAQLHSALHRPTAAEPYLRRALAVWDELVDPHPAEVLAALAEHDALLQHLGMSAEARDLADRARALQAKAAAEAAAVEQAERSGGIGFFVSADGLLLTAGHVVRGATQLSVVCPNGVALLPESSIQLSEDGDLATVATQSPTATYLSRADRSSIRVAEDVFAVGFPATRRDLGYSEVTKGFVLANEGPKGELDRIQVAIRMLPGSSGAPILDEQGEVVGVVVSSSPPPIFTAAMRDPIVTAVRGSTTTWPSQSTTPEFGFHPADIEAIKAHARAALCVIDAVRP